MGCESPAWFSSSPAGLGFSGGSTTHNRRSGAGLQGRLFYERSAPTKKPHRGKTRCGPPVAGLESGVGLSGFEHPLRISFLVRPASNFPLQNARQNPKPRFRARSPQIRISPVLLKKRPSVATCRSEQRGALRFKHRLPQARCLSTKPAHCLLPVAAEGRF